MTAALGAMRIAAARDRVRARLVGLGAHRSRARGRRRRARHRAGGATRDQQEHAAARDHAEWGIPLVLDSAGKYAAGAGAGRRSDQGPALTDLAALSSPEAAHLADEGALLAVPVASTEQHGAHLPLSTDTDLAVALCARLAESRPGVVVAPPLAYGSSGEHEGFAGTIPSARRRPSWCSPSWAVRPRGPSRGAAGLHPRGQYRGGAAGRGTAARGVPRRLRLAAALAG